MTQWHSHNASPSRPPLYFLSLSRISTHTLCLSAELLGETFLPRVHLVPDLLSLKHEANPNFGKRCAEWWHAEMCSQWQKYTLLLFSRLSSSFSVLFCVSFALVLCDPSCWELWPTDTHAQRTHSLLVLNYWIVCNRDTRNTHHGRVIRHRGEPRVHACKHTLTPASISKYWQD